MKRASLKSSRIIRSSCIREKTKQSKFIARNGMRLRELGDEMNKLQERAEEQMEFHKSLVTGQRRQIADALVIARLFD